MTYALPEITRINRQIGSFLSLWGSHSLAYHSLQAELSHFTTQSGYLAYIDFQNETIVLGDPIAKADSYKDIITEFLEFRPKCSFVQVSKVFSTILANFDFSVNYFGVESQIDLPFQTNGKQKKDIRLLRNSARRNKIEVREIFNRLELHAVNASLKRCNQSSKEYAFLSRPITQGHEKDVRIFGGFQNNQLVSYSLFDPMYSGGEIIGYAEVISRQIKSSPKGSRTYTLLEAMGQFSDENIGSVNIGLLPFYPCESSKANYQLKSNRVIDKIFSTLYKSSPFVSNFSGLSFHKSRYRGDFIPKYFASNSKNPYKALLCIFKLTTGNWFPKMKF